MINGNTHKSQQYPRTATNTKHIEQCKGGKGKLEWHNPITKKNEIKWEGKKECQLMCVYKINMIINKCTNIDYI